EYQVKKFLVKFVDYSFWEVQWVDEFQIRMYSYPMFIAFSRKYDMTTPMYLEDGETLSDDLEPIIDLENLNETDLYKTFYVYGIKPEWLQIHRIVCIEKNNDGYGYLIKWRDLPHVNSTWESRKAKHMRNICNIKKYIIDFNNFVVEAIERPIIFQKASLKSKVYEPYEKTPSFLKFNENLFLHHYQLEGLNWIRYSCYNETNVILADEMGLGKTVQSIAFLLSLYKEKQSCGPFLVCAPLSTLPNWEREFEIWAPDFYVVTLSMTRENREFIKNEEFYLKKCSPKIPRSARKNFKFHVLLVSYEVAHIEFSTLKSIKWSVLVLDEAHRIKNKQSKLHQNLADYRFKFKLLLTGTPLQNNLEELFHLLNFLSSKDFSKAEDFLHEFKDLNKEAQIEKLHKMLGKRLLRRLKSDVLKEIPIKSEVIVPVDLCPLQRKYYKAILNRSYSTLVQKGNTSSSLLNVLMELKKCCNHPFLFHLSEEEEPFDESTGYHKYSNLVADSQSFIFLLSTRAGGLGINLATADTVIIYDSDWNPHNDIQALSRAHRLGQLKKVMIYRFVTRNSVEERILEVAKKKMMLTHLVVHSGLGKNENLSKRELDDILKFGTCQLFTNTDDEINKLEYDDDAVEKLLNRNINVTEATESGINEYFSSFKVIDCAVKQPIQKEPSESATGIQDSTKYWESILKSTPEFNTTMTFDEFGKGKRLRRQIKYVDQEMKDIEEVDADSDYDAAKEKTSSSDLSDGDEEEENEKPLLTVPKSAPIKKDFPRVPPLSTCYSNLNVEVELKRKQTILNKLVTFGIPLPDIEYTYTKWGLDKEENCTIQDFKNHLRNTFASLDCSASRFPLFIDKFPLDESGCQSVLSRISIMELIKSKVIEYASYLPYMIPLLIDEHLIHTDDLNEDYFNLVKKYLKNSQEYTTKNLSFSINPPLNNLELIATKSDFKFNIEDYGYTDLHIVWDAEQSIRDQNLWWRYHDLWLLAGICVHGYNEFNAIFSDLRFKLLHLAFINSKEDKIGFVRRRLDLLEQSLVIEDIVKRMIEQKIYLRPESNIIKMQNKIFELNSLIESGRPILENYNAGKKSYACPMGDLLSYCQLLCADIKNDTLQLSRYILSSSLRALQIFPNK
ncbi:hypothetical protein HZS_5752, partial [Henneguya salminicola]